MACQSKALEQFQKHFPHFTWDHTSDQILALSSSLIKEIKEVYDKAVAVSSAKATFATVLEPIVLYQGIESTTAAMLHFYSEVSPDQEVRRAGSEAYKALCDFSVETSMRKDVYDALKLLEKKNEPLEYEQARLLKKSLLDRTRDGLNLPLETREKVEAIMKEHEKICIEFQKNISEENTSFTFSLEELDGMTQDFISGLEKVNGKYQVTLKYPHVIPLLQMCRVESTRKTMERGFNSRCIKENVSLLERAIVLRHEKAQILGYKTHADYITEILMVKSSQNVQDFLHSIADKLKNSGKVELARLLQLKEQECKERGISFDRKINAWDSSYYQKMVERVDFSVNQDVIKEFFPLEHVTEELLEIYQSLLRLRYEKVPDAPVWHPDVSLFAVHDLEAEDRLIGYFYLDLFPRPGKYSHAACFGLQEACRIKSGRQLACAAMVANFTKPLADKPSLLTHREVETYFHEFGHVMHHICSWVNYSTFSGTSVERDFVEAPSQMLENWCWDKESLKRISCHHETKKPLSDELINKLINSRKANISLFNLRQVAFGLFDNCIHSSPCADTYQVYCKFYYDLLGISPTEGTNFAASFGHMCGGYDARYYGYLWSQVYSCDMFWSRFLQEGVFNPITGLDYRRKILQPGSSRDGMQMIQDFLGRKPSNEPFFKLNGITT